MAPAVSMTALPLKPVGPGTTNCGATGPSGSNDCCSVTCCVAKVFGLNSACLACCGCDPAVVCKKASGSNPEFLLVAPSTAEGCVLFKNASGSKSAIVIVLNVL